MGIMRPENKTSGHGAKLRQARKELGLSQNALAMRAGISAMRVSEIERSHTVPDTEAAAKLCEVLGFRVQRSVRLIAEVQHAE